MAYRSKFQDEFPDNVSRFLIAGWLLWFLLYLGTGALAVMSRDTSFLARTVEQVSTEWVQLSFLNMPLQSGIAVLALLGGMMRRDSLRWLVFLLAVANAALALGHIGLSFWFELR